MYEAQIPVGAARVSASVHGDGATAVVLGHGAGGNRRTALLVALAEDLAASGRRALVYNFPYTEQGRKAPDPAALLETTVRAVADHARQALGAERLVLGGKSMGGRMASQVVAKGAAADGLVFLGYPLHPPGRTTQLRDQHLASIPCPMLFVQGTRDAFAQWDLLGGVLERLGPRATLHRVEGGDHSFVVPRRAGGERAAVEREIRRAVVEWIGRLGL
jgi:predicted alpha/beta-hydrolase family hydrolase